MTQLPRICKDWQQLERKLGDQEEYYASSAFLMKYSKFRTVNARRDLLFKSLHWLVNGKIMIYLEKIILCNHLDPALFRQPKMVLAYAGVLGTEEPWPGSYLPLPS